jgi:hypothetical protein
MDTYRLRLNLQLFADDQTVDAEPEEVADPPMETEIEEAPLDEKEPIEDADPVNPQDKPKQSPEMDRAFAELRREKEEAQRQLRERDNWVAEQFGHLGIKDWDGYQLALAEQKKKQKYEEQGIDYDAVREIAKEEAANHPDVLKAKQIEQREAINAEIRGLKSSYPDVDITEIKDMKDLVQTLEKLPNWEEIQKRVAKGYDLKDAYELANRDAIAEKRAKAAAQATRNNARSKDHLKPSGSQAADDIVIVSPEEMALFRKTGTKKTDAEIIAWKKKQMMKR